MVVFTFSEEFVANLLKGGVSSSVFWMLKDQCALFNHPKFQMMLDTAYHDEIYDKYYLDEDFEKKYQQLV